MSCKERKMSHIILNTSTPRHLFHCSVFDDNPNVFKNEILPFYVFRGKSMTQTDLANIFLLIISRSDHETREYLGSAYKPMRDTELIPWLQCYFHSCLPAFSYSAETMQASLVHECRRSSQGLSHSTHATGRWNKLWSWDGRFSRRVSLVSRDYPRMRLLCVSAFFLFAVNFCSASWINVFVLFVWCSMLSSELKFYSFFQDLADGYYSYIITWIFSYLSIL